MKKQILFITIFLLSFSCLHSGTWQARPDTSIGRLAYSGHFQGKPVETKDEILRLIREGQRPNKLGWDDLCSRSDRFVFWSLYSDYFKNSFTNSEMNELRHEGQLFLRELEFRMDRGSTRPEITMNLVRSYLKVLSDNAQYASQLVNPQISIKKAAILERDIFFLRNMLKSNQTGDYNSE